MANAPQSTFTSTQDVVNPDVKTYYKIIQNIDSFRSRFNVSTSNLNETISRGDIDQVISNNNMNEVTYQESRCNAFYRMIGFPIVAPDGSQFYNPGHDPDAIRDENKITKKLNTANAVLSGLSTILTQRENYPKVSNLVFISQDTLSTNIAIASMFVRPLEKQIDTSIKALEIDQQVFKVPDRALVGAGGDLSTSVLVSEDSIHILRPFIVDPRVDFTVTPAVNRICVPFLKDKSKTKLAVDNYLKRPYLERVIEIRCATNDITFPQAVANTAIQGVISFIKSAVDIVDQTLVDTVADPSTAYTSGTVLFLKYIKIIDALITQLVNAKTEIHRIQERINWQPIPNINGPEFGATLRDVDPTDTANNRIIEKNIVDQQSKKIFADAEFNLGLDNADLGNFALNIDNVVFGALKNVPNVYDQQLSTMLKQRNSFNSIAANHLRTIEIIMGEFSGLGLLDIMAIQAALWLMPKPALVGFLDADAVDRVNKTKFWKQRIALPGGSEITSSLQEFEKALSNIYALAQSFYDNAVNGGEKLNNIQ